LDHNPTRRTKSVTLSIDEHVPQFHEAADVWENSAASVSERGVTVTPTPRDGAVITVRQYSLRDQFRMQFPSFFIPGLIQPTRLASLFLAAASLTTLFGQTDWPSYGHDPGGMKYSPLDQINTGNVAGLAPAWQWRQCHWSAACSCAIDFRSRRESKTATCFRSDAAGCQRRYVSSYCIQYGGRSGARNRQRNLEIQGQ
jgi:hypothetical protein